MKDETRVKIALQDLKDAIFFMKTRRGRDIKNGVFEEEPIDKVIQRLATIASWHTFPNTEGAEAPVLTELDRVRNKFVQRNRELRKGAGK